MRACLRACFVLVLIAFAAHATSAQKNAVVVSIARDAVSVTIDAKTVRPRRAAVKGPSGAYHLRISCRGASVMYDLTTGPKSVDLVGVQGSLALDYDGRGNASVEVLPAAGTDCPSILRAPSAPAQPRRFLIETDVVHDTVTGLTWARRASGKMNWYRARDYCAALSLPEYESGWRLPTANEVATIEREPSSKSGIAFPGLAWNLDIKDSNGDDNPDIGWPGMIGHMAMPLEHAGATALCVRGGSVSEQAWEKMLDLRPSGQPLPPGIPTGEVIVTARSGPNQEWDDLVLLIDGERLAYEGVIGRTRVEVGRLRLAQGEHKLRYLFEWNMPPVIFYVPRDGVVKIDFYRNSLSVLDTRVFVNGEEATPNRP